jgi:hypothetical protein
MAALLLIPECWDGRSRMPICLVRPTYVIYPDARLMGANMTFQHQERNSILDKSAEGLHRFNRLLSSFRERIY